MIMMMMMMMMMVMVVAVVLMMMVCPDCAHRLLPSLIAGMNNFRTTICTGIVLFYLSGAALAYAACAGTICIIFLAWCSGITIAFTDCVGIVCSTFLHDVLWHTCLLCFWSCVGLRCMC